MEQTLTIPQQIKKALDGRTNRWLALEIKMPESELSKRMNGKMPFSKEQLKSIESRLGVELDKVEA